ncbi:MAG: hypothetical protein SFX72_20880 [Isosphaeraceae bacterium]|nr:hypothetical protein [Isosphaeraceae bacterium]
MSIGLSLIAFGLLSGAPTPGETKPATAATSTWSARVAITDRAAAKSSAAERARNSYEIRILHTPAQPWRERFYSECSRVGRSGISTIWTIEEAKVGGLLRLAQESPATIIVTAPKITAFDGADASMSTIQARPYVCDIERRVEQTAGDRDRVVLTPVVDTIDEGVFVKLAGKSDRDRTRLALEIHSRWVCSVNQATAPEKTEVDGDGDSAIVAAAMQLPQVVDTKVTGEYAIPRGSVLIAGLGTAVTLDSSNRPVVMERLALISARRILTEAEEKATIETSARPKVDATLKRTGLDEPRELPAAVVTRPLVLPPIPRRDLPGGIELPPLPDDSIRIAGIHTVPAPQASSQMMVETAPPAVVERPTTAQMLRRDPNVMIAAHDPAPVGRSMFGPGVPVASAPAAGMISQLLRFDPNVKTAAREPMPIGQSVLATTPAAISLRNSGRDEAVGRASYVAPSKPSTKEFRIPFLGRISIDIDIHVD